MNDLDAFKLAEESRIVKIEQIEVSTMDGSDSYIITFDTGNQLKLTSGYYQYDESTGISVEWLNPNDEDLSE